MIKPIYVTQQESESFWSKVDIRSANECWEWTRHRNKKGYGIFTMGKRNVLAHDVAYVIKNGNVQSGLNICHSCDNPSCCNPNHLWAGTPKENTEDMVKKGRQFNLSPREQRAENNPNAKLNWDKVREIRELRKRGMTHQAIASIFKISHTQVGQIVTNKDWKE